MHLDTVMTMVNEDTFTEYAGLGQLPSYTIEPGVTEKELKVTAHPPAEMHNAIAQALRAERHHEHASAQARHRGHHHPGKRARSGRGGPRCMSCPVEREGI